MPAPTTYFPEQGAFWPTTMDVYSNGGTYPPVPGPDTPRESAVNILITGVYPEGSRNRQADMPGYTHLIIVDPAIQVQDAYLGTNTTPATTGDVLAIPSGTQANYWVAQFVYQTVLPGIGRKKIILADRRTAPGNWATLA